MTRWIRKVNWYKGQFRITIPSELVSALGWGEASYIMLTEESKGSITLRRFIVEETLKSQSKTDRPKAD